MPEKPGKLLPALYGGLIMAAISVIPGLKLINCLCCAGIMLGGFLAVFFYKNDLKPTSPPLTNGDAVALGAIAGLIGAVATTLLAVLAMSLFGTGMGSGFKQLEDMGYSNNLPPEALQMIRWLTQGSVLIWFGFIVNLVIQPLFGLLGGLIGYAVFKPKTPPVMPPPPAPGM
jgi:hypothetical protein